MSQSPSQTRSKARDQMLRRARPTTAAGPRAGVVGSLAFHALVFAAVLITFNSKLPSQETHVVPVDLVTIADQTNVQAMAPKAQPQPEPEKMEIPVPERVAPPEPDMAEPAPSPDAPLPDFKIAKEKPKDQPKTRKEQQKDFADLLNKLTAPDKPVKNAKQGPRVVQQQGLGTAMTADLVSALQSQIHACWNNEILRGAPNPADVVVDFHLRLNPDGTVGSAELLTRSGSPYTSAAANAASRAIYACQPYHLPPNRYQEWKDVNPLHFDPRADFQ